MNDKPEVPETNLLTQIQRHVEKNETKPTGQVLQDLLAKPKQYKVLGDPEGAVERKREGNARRQRLKRAEQQKGRPLTEEEIKKALDKPIRRNNTKKHPIMSAPPSDNDPVPPNGGAPAPAASLQPTSAIAFAQDKPMTDLELQPSQAQPPSGTPMDMAQVLAAALAAGQAQGAGNGGIHFSFSQTTKNNMTTNNIQTNGDTSNTNNNTKKLACELMDHMRPELTAIKDKIDTVRKRRTPPSALQARGCGTPQENDVPPSPQITTEFVQRRLFDDIEVIDENHLFQTMMSMDPGGDKMLQDAIKRAQEMVEDGETFPSCIRVLDSAKLHLILSASLHSKELEAQEPVRVAGKRVILFKKSIVYFTSNDLFDEDDDYFGKEDDAAANQADIDCFFDPIGSKALGYFKQFSIASEGLNCGDFSVTVGYQEDTDGIQEALTTVLSVILDFHQEDRVDDNIDEWPRVSVQGFMRDGGEVGIPLTLDAINTAVGKSGISVEFFQLRFEPDQMQRMTTARAALSFNRCSCPFTVGYILDDDNRFQDATNAQLQLRFVGDKGLLPHRNFPFDIHCLARAVKLQRVKSLTLDGFCLRDVDELEAFKTLYKLFGGSSTSRMNFSEIELKVPGHNMLCGNIRKYLDDDPVEMKRFDRPQVAAPVIQPTTAVVEPSTVAVANDPPPALKENDDQHLHQRSYGLCGIYCGYFVRKYKKNGQYVFCAPCKKNAKDEGSKLTCGRHKRQPMELATETKSTA